MLKLFSAFVLSFSLAFAANQNIVLGINSSQSLSEVLSSYQIVSQVRVGSSSTYKVTFDTSKSTSQLLTQLRATAGVSWAESNQISGLDSLEPAASVDSRVIFILDDIESRVIFILDGEQTLFSPLYNQAYVEQTRANLAWPYTKGRGVTVAVLDTGVDSHHPYLASNLVQGFDFVDFDAYPDEERSGLDTNENGKLDEGFGHGTHVAGTLKTIAPEVNIMPIRVADSDGQADLFNLVQGIAFAIYNGANVINLSLSVMEPSPLLVQWMNFAKQVGVVVVTSAGNDNSSQLGYPANIEKEVITVASIENNYTKSDFSNFSRNVDVSAPGSYIINAHPGGTYVARSGTSMSAPMVSGEAAIILSLVPGASVDYVAGRIRNHCDSIDAYNPNYRGKLGKGIIDIWDAITVQNYKN